MSSSPSLAFAAHPAGELAGVLAPRNSPPPLCRHALRHLALALVALLWQFLYFLPLPHQHGSLRPISGPLLRTVCGRFAAAVAAMVRMFLAMGVGGGGAACWSLLAL